MNFKRIVLAASSLAIAFAGPAHADATSDLQAQMEVLQKQLDAVKTQLYDMQQKQKSAEAKPAPAPAGTLVQMKPDAGVTFLVPGGGEVQLYGNLDVSFDYTTKGLKSDYGDNGGDARRQGGLAAAISTNLSYLGVRGKHPLRTTSTSSGSWRRASTFPPRPGRRRRRRTPATPSTARCFRATASSASPARIGAP